tara:strand:+ start:9343 stop:9471 length:129 start_codon:yes stop_codon:yes gene_type:complete
MKMTDLLKMSVEQLQEIEAELWHEWSMVRAAIKVVKKLGEEK